MFCDKLKDLRLERELNKKQMSELLGLKYTTYNNYELGTREPNSELLVKISKEFDVTIDYLLENTNVLELSNTDHDISPVLETKREQLNYNKEDFVKQKIKETGYSIKGFATNIDLPYTTLLSMLKNGLGGASVDNVIKICNGLGITIEELIDEEKKGTPDSEESKVPNSETVKILTDTFRQLGIIDPGGDISDADLEFMQVVATLFRYHLKKKGGAIL